MTYVYVDEAVASYSLTAR